MCGIFGVSVTESAGCPPRDIERAFRELLLLSESRNKEAASFYLPQDDSLDYDGKAC